MDVLVRTKPGSLDQPDFLLHFFALHGLPQLCHCCSAVFLEKSTSVETGEHDNKKGCNIEKEESGEEGAQPGKHEQGRADQGEVEHGRGGLHRGDGEGE